MSVLQKANAPKVPDWDADEILDYLADKYDDPEERREELDMDDSEMINWAHDLEPGEGDLDRQMEVLGVYKMLEDEYESNHWVNEADARFHNDKEGKVIYYGLLRDPDNEEAYICIAETEYVDDLD